MSKIVCIREKIMTPGGEGPASALFPERWPGEYRRLAESLGPASPLLAVGTPHPSEAGPDPEGWSDPVGEERCSPLPFLHRKYRDRALLLVTSRCGFYCRFCFRRAVAPGEAREPDAAALDAALGWVRRTPEIREVILSGGDPLMLANDRLADIAEAVGEIPHIRRLRVHTRMAVTEPRRVDGGLVSALTRPGLPLAVVVHLVHPAEVRPGFAAAVARLQRAGIEVRDQSVLLAGVNDDAGTLGELFFRLAGLGVAPHYLHHPDRARGNARFRLTLARGLALHAALREWAAARGCPEAVAPYVVDLPDGSGKTPVAALAVEAEERRAGGRRLRYRWTRPAGWDAVAPARAFSWWDVWEGSERPASGPSPTSR